MITHSNQNPPKPKQRTCRGGKNRRKKKYREELNPFSSNSQSCLSSEVLVVQEDAPSTAENEKTVLANNGIKKSTKDSNSSSDKED